MTKGLTIHIYNALAEAEGIVKRLTKHHRTNQEQKNPARLSQVCPRQRTVHTGRLTLFLVPTGDDSLWTLEIDTHYLWIFLCWSRGKLHALYCAQNDCQQ